MVVFKGQRTLVIVGSIKKLFVVDLRQGIAL
jgi:hypothetical protein